MRKTLWIYPALAMVCGLLTLSAEEVTHPWVYKKVRSHQPGVLHRIYPDQNAYRLYNEIPSGLRHKRYGIYSISHGYDLSRFNFNKRFNIFPHLILTPRSCGETAHIFRSLKKHGLSFSLRSGGHCLEPGSLSPDYVIDLRNLNWIKPNVKKKEVYIGAGCRLGSVISRLGKLNYAIPTGTCSSVGVTGLTLGGGLGFLGRTYGLTCDSVKSLTVLLASGHIIKASRTHHSDLFWAMLGAGNGSYGIVLGFTFHMHYVPVVSTATLTWAWDPTTVTEVINAWQSWVQTLPSSIGTHLYLIYANQTLSIKIVSLKVGKAPFTEWQEAFASLNPTVQTTRGSYLKSTSVWADRSPFPFLKSKSEILFEPLSAQPIQSAISFFETLRSSNAPYYALFQLEAMGGVIPQGNTAFFPRNAFAWWYQVMYWTLQQQQDAALLALQTFQEEIAPYVSPYSYANIVDYDIGADYLQVYYGTNVDRLISVKQKYDPNNLFNWRQSIPVVMPAVE